MAVQNLLGALQIGEPGEMKVFRFPDRGERVFVELFYRASSPYPVAAVASIDVFKGTPKSWSAFIGSGPEPGASYEDTYRTVLATGCRLNEDEAWHIVDAFLDLVEVDALLNELPYRS